MASLFFHLSTRGTALKFKAGEYPRLCQSLPNGAHAPTPQLGTLSSNYRGSPGLLENGPEHGFHANHAQILASDRSLNHAHACTYVVRCITD
jgi:hypothetical protein